MYIIAPLPQPGYLELCYLLGLPAVFSCFAQILPYHRVISTTLNILYLAYYFSHEDHHTLVIYLLVIS